MTFASEAARRAAAERVAVRYTTDVNGSTDAVAGLCNAAGNVLGLMPHPERFVDELQHPAWTRRRADGLGDGEPAGLRLFRAGVRAAG